MLTKKSALPHMVCDSKRKLPELSASQLRSLKKNIKEDEDRACMPAGCPTPSECREHGCHGACLPAQGAEPSTSTRGEG